MSYFPTMIYDEQYAILDAIRRELKGLKWAVGRELEEDQIYLYWKQPNAPTTVKKPIVVLSFANSGMWTNLSPHSKEIDDSTDGPLWEIIQDGELSDTLRIEVYGENPVQRSYVLRAIRNWFADFSGRGTASRGVEVRNYISDRIYVAKVILRRYRLEDTERNVVNQVYKGTLEADLTFPILRVVSTIPMLPEYETTVE